MTGKRNSLRVQDVDSPSDVGCAVQNAAFVFSQQTASLLFPLQIEPHGLCSHVGGEGGKQKLHKMQRLIAATISSPDYWTMVLLR
jgi:hypothetical protein